MSTSDPIENFIARWRDNEGGAERANYALFLIELCILLDLPQPEPASATADRNDYVFERAVTFHDEAGRTGHGRIDLYRRGCFVLEAKQSRERGGAKEVALQDQAVLPGFAAAPRGRRSAQRGWDILMRNALEQAKDYARALPESHGWPPFLLIVDVGHAIELFADFSGQGKNYRQFPDRGHFRLYLDDLRDGDVRERLRAIWLAPHSLDPARRSAVVTRDMARRLASIGRLLETRGYQPEPVAQFLMRCLFTMFAEEEKVALLPPGSFTAFLHDMRADPDGFAPLLEDLWATMDKGGMSALLRQRVRHFNGGLFADARALPLNREEIGELYEAARHDWTEVEPAIFGTLLEQALDPVERRRLGAHYTPRAYVERLVTATIIEPLQREWETEVLGTVERERKDDPAGAIRAVHDFHVKLATTRVLDPACGTGNFLYVALELMKRLEGDVLEVLADLGGQEALRLETDTVHPHNFLGLELNGRAAAITELVLWLGYLQWQLRNGIGIVDPVLEARRTVISGDAVLIHDGERIRADGKGIELVHPRRPEWPEVDYIVGNPPFIGGKDLRGRLGEAYALALWKAHPRINKSADFVMYWWDRAAELLTRKGTRLKRFGFVTTNSITQEFSRRVIARHLEARPPVSIIMAISDHPWTKATKDAAAVRIAMTVVEAGEREGALLTANDEIGLATDTPRIDLHTVTGRIHSNLTVGTNVTNVYPLRANAWLASPGVKLHGGGFIVSEAEAVVLGLDRRDGLDHHVRPYRHGRDLTGKSRNTHIIDLWSLTEDEVRRRFPEIYQHLYMTVREERRKQVAKSPTADAISYATRWWEFGKPRPELRQALVHLPRYIATVETTKHRIFQFLDGAILPDNMLACFALADGYSLGILSSRIHQQWTYANCGLIGVASFEQGHRYTKSRIWDPFPFPDAFPEQRHAIATLADELDATRKDVLAEHSDLTLTTLYNLREKLLAEAPLDIVEQDQRRRGRIDILIELHCALDAAVAAAYGWPADLSDEAIVAHLVALNAERHAEERAGHVRWLRPDFQIARAGLPQIAVQRTEQIEADLQTIAVAKPIFPRDAVSQTAAVFASLREGRAVDATQIAMRYRQGRRLEPRIAATLSALVRLGHVHVENGQYRLRRAAA